MDLPQYHSVAYRNNYKQLTAICIEALPKYTLLLNRHKLLW